MRPPAFRQRRAEPIHHQRTVTALVARFRRSRNWTDWLTRAVASNLDLRIATANLLQARALRLGAKADFFPVVNGEASYNNNKYSEAGTLQRARRRSAPGTLRRRFRRHLGTGYFRARPPRLPVQHRCRCKPPQATRRDVQVSLASEVARNYFELRGAQNELAVLRRNADNQTRNPQNHPGATRRRQRDRTGCRPRPRRN